MAAIFFFGLNLKAYAEKEWENPCSKEVRETCAWLREYTIRGQWGEFPREKIDEVIKDRDPQHQREETKKYISALNKYYLAEINFVSLLDIERYFSEIQDILRKNWKLCPPGETMWRVCDVIVSSGEDSDSRHLCGKKCGNEKHSAYTLKFDDKTELLQLFLNSYSGNQIDIAEYKINLDARLNNYKKIDPSLKSLSEFELKYKLETEKIDAERDRKAAEKDLLLLLD